MYFAVLEHSIVAHSVIEQDETEASHNILFLVLYYSNVLDFTKLAEIVTQVGWLLVRSLHSVMSGDRFTTNTLRSFSSSTFFREVSLSQACFIWICSKMPVSTFSPLMAWSLYLKTFWAVSSSLYVTKQKPLNLSKSQCYILRVFLSLIMRHSCISPNCLKYYSNSSWC